LTSSSRERAVHLQKTLCSNCRGQCQLPGTFTPPLPGESLADGSKTKRQLSVLQHQNESGRPGDLVNMTLTTKRHLILMYLYLTLRDKANIISSNY